MKKLLLWGILFPLFVACSTDESVEDQPAVDLTDGLNQTYDIVFEDLVGKWNLVSMHSVDVPVNLNLDDVESTDILSETTCFDQMYFTFDLNGNVTTQQAKLFFKTQSGKMECQAGTYTAEYELNGNQLKIGFMFGGIKIYQTRTIDVFEENGEEFLEVVLTYAEAREYLNNPDYVSPTGATQVEAVIMLYKKE